jgi:hypothetical protein
VSDDTVYLLVSVATGTVLGVFASTALARQAQADLHHLGWRLHVKPWEVTR